jgi:hypothetical protein
MVKIENNLYIIAKNDFNKIFYFKNKLFNKKVLKFIFFCIKSFNIVIDFLL